jgi:16S rRNA (adenine1518-N6/adenine1519-N6)-dimethyltransferase
MSENRTPRSIFSGHVARKRFGQNFLRSAAVIERIVLIIDPQPGDELVEVGPGQGALTFPLLRQIGRMTAIELDRDLAAGLRVAASRYGDLNLIEADALRVDLTALAAGRRLRMIGNFPYNISTPLLFFLMDHLPVIADIHCMLQKEVVERMAANHGNKDYGRLSVMLQARCQIENMLEVPGSAFEPVPKVDSAIARLTPLAVQPDLATLDALDRIVRAGFAQRRKTLTNSMRGVVDAAQLEQVGLSAGLRAEQISVAQFLALARLIAAG